MDCPACGHLNEAPDRFCEQCGADLPRVCPQCGAAVTSTARFCGRCRAALTPASAPPASQSPATPPLPESFGGGRYVVRSFLGEGGRKRVYLAHDGRLDRDVAIATIRAEGLDADARARVAREAQAMGRLGDHPHIVTVHDVFDGDDGTPVIVARYMAGGAVDDLLDKSADHRLPVPEAIEIAAQVCDALAHAHGRGVVHRDVKPGNIWLTDAGEAMLGDFGLAMESDRSRITLRGMMVGTLAYMSPEQALGRNADARSDLYALGATLYEMVAGRPPFIGDDPVAIISQHINTPPVAPSWHNKQVPRALEATIMKLLQKAPDDRPGSAAEVAAQLRAAAATVADEPNAVEQGPQGSAASDVRGVDWAVFVARQKEMDQLKDALERTLGGRAALAMVVGDPGIGKTRLVDEFSVYARLRGCQLLSGRSYETQASVPYRAFVDALRQYVRSQPDETLARQLGSEVAQVARLVSDIRERFPGVPPAPEDDPDDERLRLFDSVTHFLRSAAQEQPVLLVLDDLQWSDAPTVEMLQHVARETVHDRVMIAGIVQEAELTKDHPLAAAMPELRRHPGFQRIAMHPFARDEIEGWLAVMEPSDARRNERRALAALLFPLTGGNPLFIREAINYLIDTGKISHEDGLWTSHINDPAALVLPPGVRDTFARRLERLSEPCVKALTRASGIGRGFTWEVFLAIADTPEDALIELLEEALGARLLTELPQTGAGAVSYEFISSQLRQTLYESLSGPRRAVLHREIGEALEALYEGAIDAHLPELAYHFGRATSAAHRLKAAEYATRAGDKARAVSAWDDAARNYEDAIAHLDRARAPHDERRCRTLLALARCNQLRGRWQENIELLRQAAAIARAIPSAQLLAQAATQFETAAVLSADAALLRERNAILDEALTALGDGDSEERVLVLCYRVQAAAAASSAAAGRAAVGIFAYAGEKDPAILVQARQALAIAERIGDDRLIATAAQYLHNYELAPNNARQTLDLAERGLVAARRTRAHGIEADLLASKAYDLLPLGEIAEFRRNAEALATVIKRGGVRSMQWVRDMMEVTLGIADGNLAAADQRVSVYASGAGVSATAGAATLGQLFYLRDLQGRLPEMEGAFRGIIAAAPGVPVFVAALALIQSSAGRPAEATATVDALLAGGLEAIPPDMFWTAAVSNAADACAEAGYEAPAQVLYDALLPFASSTTGLLSIVPLGSAGRALGRLAMLLGRWDDAERHYQEAIEVNDRCGLRAWLAMTRLHYGEMLISRDAPGDRERALDVLQQALDAAQDMGMAKVVSDALALKLRAQDVSLPGDIYTSLDLVANSVQAAPPKLQREVIAPDGTVTIMFSDIENSTLLADRLGDKRFMDVLREHNAIIREHLAPHGGYEVKSEGDGFMVVFQSARRGLECALDIQRALAARNEHADESVRVRMGLHTGEVIKEGEDFFGRNVIMAARVAAQAKGGEILISGVLKAIVESAGDLQFAAPRIAELKGLSGTHEMYPLVFGGAAVPAMQDPHRNGAPPPPQAEVQYCIGGDGTSIAYTVEGEGPTLVMCPAFWESFTDDPLLAAWAPVYRGRRIVRYDPRGLGRSARDAPSFTHEAFVSDLESVIDATTTGPIALFAATFSVPWAIDYAARHPERVHRLILAHGYARAVDVISRENVDSLVALIRSNWPMAVQLFGGQGFESDPALGAEFARIYARNIAPGAAGQWFEALYESTDVRNLLAEIRAPALVWHRREDTILPFAGAEEIAAGIPGARLVAQSGTGAISSGDDVAANLRLLVDFLDE